MRILKYAVLALAVLSHSLSAQTLTITNATVVDVSNGALRRGTTVVIDGNRITSVSQPARAAAPGARVIDAKGMYLIPGLWDMHAHVYFDSSTAAVANDVILPLFLVNGVTGVRDMGSLLDPVLRGRDDIAAHRVVGPRLVVSGPMLDGPDVNYAAAIAIKTPDDGRKAVAMLKSRGVDFIKIQSGVPHDAYLAIAKEAKRLGIEFEGHVPDAVRAADAVAAGQRSFEHLIGVFEASSPDEDKYLSRKYLAGKDTSGRKTVGMFLQTFDAAREKKIIQLLATNHVWQCPTLFWERGQWLVDTVDYNKDPDLAYAPRSWVKQWAAARKGILQSLDTDPLAIRERFVAHELDIVRKMHAAQVPFLAGTDTPAGVDVLPGISLHRELERFVAAGFTPLEALQTATLNPAKYYGKLNDFGSVQPGRIADLVLLRANPLENIANTRTIGGVVADGRYFSTTDLDQRRERLKQLAATK
ncbi:MAG: amidohydrolase family protein [bacterium]